MTVQQNLEIHKKMGMTDEQLEAYERQEREVSVSDKITFEYFLCLKSNISFLYIPL